MKRKLMGAALGFAVAAGLALATPARAQNHWMSADTSGGVLWTLTVGRGPYGEGLRCTGPDACTYSRGAPIVVWQWKNTPDQTWFGFVPGSGPWTGGLEAGLPLPGDASTLVPSGQYLSLPRSTRAEGAAVINWTAGAYPDLTQDQKWTAIEAERFGAPYSGCYVFQNWNSGYVLGVDRGVMKNGAPVIQWELIRPGVQDTHWHPDQFWCPFY